MKLTEVPLDESLPLVCSGCKAIGPVQSNKDEWGRLYPSWYMTKVLYLGNYKYQTGVHCGACSRDSKYMSEDVTWPLSQLEETLDKTAPGNVVAFESQQDVLERVRLIQETYRPTPEMLAGPIRAKRTRMTDA